MTDPEHEERLSNSGSFGTDSQQTFDTAAGVVSVRSSTSTSTQVPTVPVTETSSYHTATRPMSSATEELQTGGDRASTGAIAMPTMTHDPSTTAPLPQAKEASAVPVGGGVVSGLEAFGGSVMGEPPAATAAAEHSAPPGEIGLDVLLVSGKRQRFLFAPDVTVGEVKSRIHKDWPQDWQSECPRSKSSLRILYLGKFLADSTTLESNNFRKGETTVVHILIRQEESRADALAKGKSSSTCGCCTIV